MHFIHFYPKPLKQLKNPLRKWEGGLQNRKRLVPNRTVEVKNRKHLVPDRTVEVKNRKHLAPDRTVEVKNRKRLVPDRTVLGNNIDRSVLNRTQPVKNKTCLVINVHVFEENRAHKVAELITVVNK